MSDLQYTKPEPGKLVKIRVRSRSNYYYRTSDYIETEYTGTVLPDERWTRPNAFVLNTADGSRYPVRDIPLHDVVGFEYLDGTAASLQKVSSQIQTWVVAGSKGSSYTVTKEGNKYSCTCPGFSFRRHCKHVDSVKS
jgi:hypothetical protein